MADLYDDYEVFLKSWVNYTTAVFKRLEHCGSEEDWENRDAQGQGPRRARRGPLTLLFSRLICPARTCGEDQAWPAVRGAAGRRGAMRCGGSDGMQRSRAPERVRLPREIVAELCSQIQTQTATSHCNPELKRPSPIRDRSSAAKTKPVSLSISHVGTCVREELSSETLKGKVFRAEETETVNRASGTVTPNERLAGQQSEISPGALRR